MKLSRSRTLSILRVLLLVLLVVQAHTQGGPIIGGFDAGRGGYMSLRDSGSLALLRSSVTSQFPGATFTASGTLTSAYLSTLNYLFVSSATSNNSAITPLSASEQTALRNFVLSGGTALIFVDNDTFDPNAPLANSSLLTPFGLHITGTLGGSQSGTIINSANPIVTGRAGTATGIDTLYPGWLDNLNGSLRIANQNANGAPALSAFLPGALGAGSGGAVFFTDANLALDGTRTTNNTILILNSLALATLDNMVAAPGQCVPFPVRLATPAGPGGVYITLSSGDPSRVSLALSPQNNFVVYIPADATVPDRRTPNALVCGVTFGSAVITAAATGYPSASQTVRVAETLSFFPTSVTVTGTSRQIRLTLSETYPALLGGLTVSLSSDNPAVATVPPTVTIPANATSVSVPVTGVSFGTTIIHVSGAPNATDAAASVTFLSGIGVGN